jgi:protein TonB
VDRFARHHVIIFGIVAASHLAGLAAALAVQSEPVPETITPPTIMAVLVNTVQAEPTPVKIKPVEPEKPAAKVRPKPVAKPKPLPKAPPSERAVQAPPEPPPVKAVAKTAAPTASKPAKAQPAPVQPPSAAAKGLRNPAPVYPQMSRKKKEQGTVWLLLEVKADGTVGDISIKQSSGFSRLDQAARQAVKKWQFEPAKQNGKNIDFWYEMPVNFSLNP